MSLRHVPAILMISEVYKNGKLLYLYFFSNFIAQFQVHLDKISSLFLANLKSFEAHKNRACVSSCILTLDCYQE